MISLEETVTQPSLTEDPKQLQIKLLDLNKEKKQLQKSLHPDVELTRLIELTTDLKKFRLELDKDFKHEIAMHEAELKVHTQELDEINEKAAKIEEELTFPIDQLEDNLKIKQRSGFFFNMLSVFYAVFIINLPSPSYTVHNTLFNLIMVAYLKTSVMFMLSYLMTAPFNIFLLAKLKLKLNGKHLKFRLLVCVILTTFINVLILHLSDYNDSLINIPFISSLFISTLLTLICLPVITFCIEKVKQLEKIDIYDQNTQFNFFKFEVKYILNNNGFDQFPR